MSFGTSTGHEPPHQTECPSVSGSLRRRTVGWVRPRRAARPRRRGKGGARRRDLCRHGCPSAGGGHARQHEVGRREAAQRGGARVRRRLVVVPKCEQRERDHLEGVPGGGVREGVDGAVEPGLPPGPLRARLRHRGVRARRLDLQSGLASSRRRRPPPPHPPPTPPAPAPARPRARLRGLCGGTGTRRLCAAGKDLIESLLHHATNMKRECIRASSVDVAH